MKVRMLKDCMSLEIGCQKAVGPTSRCIGDIELASVGTPENTCKANSSKELMHKEVCEEP